MDILAAISVGLSKFPSFLRTKATDIAALLDALDTGAASLKSYKVVVDEGYKKNWVVFSGIGELARCAAGVPWIAFKGRGKTKAELPEDHPLLRMIRRPNPKQGQAKFIERYIVHQYLAGKVFIHVASGTAPKTEGAAAPNVAPKVINLTLLRPDLVKLKDEKNPDLGWEYTPNGGTPLPLPTSEVIPIFVFDPMDDYEGISPVSVAGLSVSQGNFSREWNANLLKNNARPSGILKSKIVLQQEQIEKILDRFRAKMGGFKNAGVPVVVQGDIDWEQTSLSPGEMEWLDGQRVADRSTAVTMGVPPQLLGDPDASTYANYQEARKALYMERVLPLLGTLRDELNNRVAPAFGEDVYLELNTDDVEALQEDRKQAWERTAAGDWLSINEKRAATKFEELPGEGGRTVITASGVIITSKGEVLVPATLIPIESVGEMAQAQLEAAKEPPVKPGEDGEGGAGDEDAEAFEDAEDEAEGKDPAKGKKAVREARGAPAIIIKAFNLKSEAQKTAHWRAFDAMRERFVHVARALVIRQFRRERELVVNVVKASGAGLSEHALEAIVRKEHENWERVYDQIYLVTGRHFAKQVFASLPKSLGQWLIYKRNEEDLVSVQIRQYLKKEAGRKIVGIEETTLKGIRGQLAIGTDNGESIDELAKRIDRFYLDAIIPNRSEVIARTEVIGASNMASQEAAKSTGLPMEKEWLSLRDHRTRGVEASDDYDHVSADGQRVPIEVPYRVSGERLMFPGDSSLGASAGNLIQCRCGEGYHVIE